MTSPLFIRNGQKDVLPTQQADLLYHSVLHIIHDWDTIFQQIQNVQHRLKTCSLAVSNTIAAHVLPLLLEDLYRAFPSINFTAMVTNSLEVFKVIKNESLDLGIIEKPLSDFSIKRYELMRDQLVLAGDEEKGPWLIREVDSSLYFCTKQFLDEHDIQLPTMEIHSNNIIFKMIKNGFAAPSSQPVSARTCPTARWVKNTATPSISLRWKTPATSLKSA